MASSEPMDIEPEIDDSLYRFFIIFLVICHEKNKLTVKKSLSRQRYVLGDTAMKRMAKSDILLIGLGGLGVEIGNFNISKYNVSL